MVVPASLTCARAFADDPTTRYLIPDSDKRTSLRYTFEYYLKVSALTGGSTYITSPRCEGVAMWIEPEHKEPLLSHLRAGFPFLPLRAGWSHLKRETELNLHFGRLRRELAPKRHMYLAVLAVDPAFQGQGFGSRLVRPMLQRLDELKMPAYLETQCKRNIDMYRRWDFELLREEPMPDADLKLYLMLRQPR